MNVTMKHMRAFVAVAQSRGFTKAAQVCGLSQPALTVAIRQLEESLDVPLFERTTRRVRLTADGALFLPSAERLIAEFESAIASMRGGAAAGTERVSVAALPSMAALILPDAVADLVHDAPAIRVHVRDANSSAVQRSVRAGEVDFGLGTLWEADPDLVVEPLLSDRFGLVCRADHPCARADAPLGWADLAEHPALGLAMDTGIRPLLEACPDLPARIARPTLEFSNILTIGAMLRRGLGVAVLPYMAYACLGASDLVFRALDAPDLYRPIGLMRRRSTPLGRGALQFRALVGAMCRRFAETEAHVRGEQAAEIEGAAHVD